MPPYTGFSPRTHWNCVSHSTQLVSNMKCKSGCCYRTAPGYKLVLVSNKMCFWPNFSSYTAKFRRAEVNGSFLFFSIQKFDHFNYGGKQIVPKYGNNSFRLGKRAEFDKFYYYFRYLAISLHVITWKSVAISMEYWIHSMH